MISITIAFVVFLILVVVIANVGLGPMFFAFIYKVPGGDKLGHFLLMGALSFLVNTALKKKKSRYSHANFFWGT